MHPLLIGPALTAGIAAALALVIAVADRLLNDYGEVTIDVNGGKRRYTVKGGSPLLGALAGEGVFLPSACGGRGSCGACKVRVLSDVGPHLPTETPYLTPEEVSRNLRLGCQVKVKKDIAIELPEYLFNIKKFRTTVERIRDLTYDIKELYLRIEEPAGGISFEPGQYAQLVVPPYGDYKESTQRAYSMSSRPSDSGHIELLVRLVPGGIATTWVHKHLKEGDAVEAVGPFGDFKVRPGPATMVCVAGGSGMAPFKSILYHIAETGAHPDKEIWYFFGARSGRDAFYLEELAELERRLPRFHFVPALSEPKPEDGWAGETGVVTEVLARYLKERLPPGAREGYLCGSPGMIDACVKVMTAAGMAAEDIFFDKFA